MDAKQKWPGGDHLQGSGLVDSHVTYVGTVAMLSGQISTAAKHRSILAGCKPPGR
jgi:hypothetical protein